MGEGVASHVAPLQHLLQHFSYQGLLDYSSGYITFYHLIIGVELYRNLSLFWLLELDPK